MSLANLMSMSRWYVVSRCIHSCARLGIADAIDDSPVSAEVIAQHCNAIPSKVARVLRFLATYDVFVEVEPDHFAHTESSRYLRADHPQSARCALLMVDKHWWQAFASLDDAMVEDDSAFRLQHQQGFFQSLAADSARQQQFDQGMASISGLDDAAVAQAYNFSQFDSLIDIGGGRGGLLLQICQRFPTVNAVLFEQEHVLENTYPQLKRDYAAQVDCRSGNFCEQIPTGFDAFMYKGVLHDFPDDTLETILTNTHRAMSSQSKLLVIEQVMPDDELPHPSKTMDMVMLTLLNGRQRYLHEWRDILQAHGFHLEKAIPTASIFTILECSRISL